MKPFKFQQFDIYQSKDVFRVGTDGVLLGALTPISNCRRVLEVGVGSGLVSLMLAQRNSCISIEAIDVNPNAVVLAQRNFSLSPFSRRLAAFLSDYNMWKPSEKYDLIVCNPPYFEPNPSVKDVLARQQTELTFSQMMFQSSNLLTDEGSLSMIIPAFSCKELEKLGLQNNLVLSRKTSIYGIKGGEVKRMILEFSKKTKDLVEEDFIIEKSPRNYSDQYIELTKEFHVFSS